VIRFVKQVLLCESEVLSSITDVSYLGIDMLISLSQAIFYPHHSASEMDLMWVFVFVLSHNTGGYVFCVYCWLFPCG